MLVTASIPEANTQPLNGQSHRDELNHQDHEPPQAVENKTHPAAYDDGFIGPGKRRPGRTLSPTKYSNRFDINNKFTRKVNKNIRTDGQVESRLSLVDASNDIQTETGLTVTSDDNGQDGEADNELSNTDGSQELSPNRILSFEGYLQAASPIESNELDNDEYESIKPSTEEISLPSDRRKDQDYEAEVKDIVSPHDKPGQEKESKEWIDIFGEAPILPLPFEKTSRKPGKASLRIMMSPRSNGSSQRNPDGS